MYFKLSKGIASFLFIIFLVKVPLSYAEEVSHNNITFTAQPTICVTLTQGRTCYATVTLEWNAEKKGNFCILQKVSTKQLKCWKHTKNKILSFEFESNESITYQLIKDNNELVAETTVNVTWVHKKSPRKRRWRLF